MNTQRKRETTLGSLISAHLRKRPPPVINFWTPMGDPYSNPLAILDTLFSKDKRVIINLGN